MVRALTLQSIILSLLIGLFSIGAMAATSSFDAQWSELNNAATMYHAAEKKDPRSDRTKKLEKVVQERADSLLREIAKKMDGLIRESPRPVNFDLMWADLESKVTKIAELQHKYTLPFVAIRDPSKPIGPENIGRGEFEVRYASTDAVEREKPSRLAERMAVGGAHAAASFTAQYAQFAVAQGFIELSMIGTAHLGVRADDDPMGLEDLENSLKDPVAAKAFAVFMGTNHLLTKLLRGVRNHTIPESFLPYIGMSAGFIASQAFSEMYADQNVWKCLHSRLASARGRGQVDIKSCDAAYDTWAVHNKIIQYAPTITAFMFETFIMSGVNSRTLFVGGRSLTRYVFKGIKIGSLSSLGEEAANLAKLGAFTPGGLAIGVGDFVLFLALDRVVSPLIQSQWQPFQLATFNVKTWLDKNGLHREFLFPKDSTRAPIQNAFDVEATDLKSAHEDMLAMLIQLQKSNWQMPTAAATCTAGKKIMPMPKTVAGDVAKKFDQAAASIKTQPVPSHPAWTAGLSAWWGWLTKAAPAAATQAERVLVKVGSIPYKVATLPDRWATSFANRKTSAELECEVLHRPVDLINRYSDLNYQWRQYRNQDFDDAFHKWMNLIADFTEQYQATNKVLQYLASSKFNEVHLHGPRPNLSRAAINRIIVAGVETAGNGVDALKAMPARQDYPKAPSTMGSVKTRNMADYVIAALACGPTVAEKQTWTSALLRKIDQRWSRITTYKTYVATPFGSSIAFLAPNVTDEADICTATTTLNRANEASTRGAMPDNTDVFADQWHSQKKDYSSLADYVYDHMRRDVWDSNIRHSGVAMWWMKEIYNNVKPVWQSYADRYKLLVDNKLIPNLERRDFYAGCHIDASKIASTPRFERNGIANQTTIFRERSSWKDVLGTPTFAVCQGSPAEFRAAKGVLQAIETEMRMYVRAMDWMYITDYDQKSRQPAQAQFAAAANKFYKALSLKSSLDKRSTAVTDSFNQLTALFAKHKELMVAPRALDGQILAGQPFLKTDGIKEKAEQTPHTYKAQIYAEIWDHARLATTEYQNHVAWLQGMDFDGANSSPAVKRQDSKPRLGPLTGS